MPEIFKRRRNLQESLKEWKKNERRHRQEGDCDKEFLL